jgi:hypothetical protein
VDNIEICEAEKIYFLKLIIEEVEIAMKNKNIIYVILEEEKHKMLFKKNIDKIINILLERGKNHDEDKDINKINSNNVAERELAILEHKQRSRHHLDYNKNFDLIDMLEVMCDWLTYWQSQSMSYEEMVEAVGVYCKKLNINAESELRMKNTIKYFI